MSEQPQNDFLEQTIAIAGEQKPLQVVHGTAQSRASFAGNITEKTVGAAKATLAKANAVSQSQTGKTVEEHGNVSRGLFPLSGYCIDIDYRPSARGPQHSHSRLLDMLKVIRDLLLCFTHYSNGTLFSSGRPRGHCN